MFWENDLFDEIRHLQQEMQRMWAGPYMALPGYREKDKDMMPARKQGMDWFRTPKCELCETESSMIASIELPGVDKKDISLNINDDSIEVKVEKKQEKEEKDKDHYSYAGLSHSFYRNIPLPKSVDSSKATAVYRNGVLRVEVPKAEKEQKKRIEIQ